MKFNKIIQAVVIAFLVLQLYSCDKPGEVDATFNQTPTERLNAKQKELNDVLEASDFGWKAVYYTDSTQFGGFTHLFKFKSGEVEMASDFDDDTTKHKSGYSIELGSTVSLVFTTKNKIHLLSDPLNAPSALLKGQGYKGDFQFLYYGQEKDQLLFKTNKTLQEVRFIKAKEEDWSNLYKNRQMITNLKGESRPLFRSLETNDGAKKSVFDFSFYKTTRFSESNSVEAGSKSNYKMGIAFTPTGITIRPAIKVGNQKLSEFIYDDSTGNFNASGTNGVSASIKYSNTPPYLSDFYKTLLSGQPRSTFVVANSNGLGQYPETDSPLFISELAKSNAKLESGVQVSVIALDFNFLGKLNYIFYVFTNNTALFHYVNVSENPITKSLILTHQSWEGNATKKSKDAIMNIENYLLNKNGLYVIKENYTIVGDKNAITFTSASVPFRMTAWKL
jgi:hypothetical protein